MQTTKNSSLQLDPWQRRQAAMLYYFSSFHYLQDLHALVTNLIQNVADPALDLARQQGRDAVFVDDRWGTRNTSANWENYALPILKDLQVSLAKNIGMRAFGEFNVTSASSTLRGVDEFSMAWATNDEDQRYCKATSAIAQYASRIDRTLDREPTAGWDDFEFAAEYPDFLAKHPRIPAFRVHSDIVIDTGGTPPCTGVYVSSEDPNASLQFVWAGANPCRLRPATTFSEIGLHALSLIGRQRLWFDDKALLEFACRDEYRALFENFISIDGRLDAELAAPAVSMEAFVRNPSKWHLVEIVSDDAEDTKLEGAKYSSFGIDKKYSE